MLLKSLHWHARHARHSKHSEQLQEYDVINLCLVIDYILHDIVSGTHAIWPWHNTDHHTLIKHYSIIADRLREHFLFHDAVLESARTAMDLICETI